jgi:hypothetical protein
MSCLFQLFKKKQKPLPKPAPIKSNTFSIPFFGPLPSSLEELRILEFEIGSRIFYLNKKSKKLYTNASQCHNKGDIRKALMYIRQRKPMMDEVSKLNLRRTEVQLRIYSIAPKIEVVSPLNALQVK